MKRRRVFKSLLWVLLMVTVVATPLVTGYARTAEAQAPVCGDNIWDQALGEPCDCSATWVFPAPKGCGCPPGFRCIMPGLPGECTCVRVAVPVLPNWYTYVAAISLAGISGLLISLKLRKRA